MLGVPSPEGVHCALVIVLQRRDWLLPCRPSSGSTVLYLNGVRWTDSKNDTVS